MSLISDIKYEVGKLDFEQKNLRKFGITIGLIFAAFGFWFYFDYKYLILSIIFLIIGLFLSISGIFIPQKLHNIYKIWMLGALILGWFVSRIILSILFIVIITPIGVISKILGKDFLKLKENKSNKTYWLVKDQNKINYEK
ncbi:MAG: hypothetical protein KDC52_05570, partial [Ignavibacteriae bacterium]|nr:hypothetical protein [Ignavibacteriota bacterium]